MCGRYVLIIVQNKEYWVYQDARTTAPKLIEEGFASFNIPPSTAVPVLRYLDGEKQLHKLRWGLVPSWAKGIPGKYSTINAKAEELSNKPSWRGPWRKGQRCLLLANGFFEWQDRPAGRQPFFITVKDQELFGFAGIWDKSVSEDGNTVIESCAIITMPANPFMAEIHNDKKRQPVVVRAEDRDAWLKGDVRTAEEILQRPDETWQAWEVSKRVNVPRNNDPELIDPID